MIVRRHVQKITSFFGYRKGFKLFHKGVDLRVYNDHPNTGNPTGKKLPVILPEECMFLRSVYQKKWGWTHVFRGEESGYTLKFIHMLERKFVKKLIYGKNHIVGMTMVTDYMKKKKLGEHLHFGTFKYKIPKNPENYMTEMGIEYA